MDDGRDLLSTRGRYVRDFPNFVIQYAAKTGGNQYHKTTNPNGIINFGVAENALCEDLISEKMSQPTMNEHKRFLQYYFQVEGIKSFRQALADFLTKRFKAARQIRPDNLFVTSGVGAGIDLLGHMFFEPGDSCLVLAPYYGAISANLGIRADVKCIPIQLSSKERDGCAPFEVCITWLKAALEEAREKKERVRGLLLMNPHNPTGDVLTRQKLIDILNFCAQNDLHIILDEIYALSPIGIDPEKDFHSILSIKDLPCPEKTHFVWGFSKDFGLSGFRCGVIHTLHPNFGRDSTHLIYMAAVPAIVQEKLRMLISDEEWLDNTFFPTNLRRLRKSYDFLSQRLLELNIPFHPPRGGLFLWVDLTKYLPSRDHAGEEEVFLKMLDGGLYCLPGSALFFKEPGWFRLTFAHPIEYLETGLQRFKKLLNADVKLQRRGIKRVNPQNNTHKLAKYVS